MARAGNKPLKSPAELTDKVFGFTGASNEDVTFTLETLLVLFQQYIDSGGTGIVISQKVDYYSELVAGELDNDISYVRYPEGQNWLPDQDGGDFFPEGWYSWDITESRWISANNSIAKQLQELINSKAGLSFIAESEDIVPSGVMSWRGNDMADTNQFSIRFSKFNRDGLDVTDIFDLMSSGSLIQFKDIDNRAAILEYVSHTEGVDGDLNDVIDVEVIGRSTNTSYVYLPADSIESTIGFYIKSSSGGGSGGFPSTAYVASLPNGDLGNIQDGDSVPSFADMDEFLAFASQAVIDAYIQSNSGMSTSGFSTTVVEVGTGYAPTLTVNFNTGQINNGDNTIAGDVSGDLLTVNISSPSNPNAFVDNAVTGNTTGGTLPQHILTEGTNSWVTSGTNAAGTTTYTDSNGDPQTITSIENAKADTVPSNNNLNKVARFPFLYGMDAADLSSGGTLFYDAGLTKDLGAKSDKNVLLNGSSEFIYFGYPASYGALNEIIDGNGFNVTSSFDQITVNVTSTGLDSNYTESYIIYKTFSVTTVSGQTFNFNF